MKGTVKWFNRNKGYGFIQGEDGKDYFVHHSVVADGKFLRDNDVVSFEEVETERGKQAQNVVLLEKGSDVANSSRNEQRPAEEVADEPAEEVEESVADEPAEEVEESVAEEEAPAEEDSDSKEPVEEVADEPAEEDSEKAEKKEK